MRWPLSALGGIYIKRLVAHLWLYYRRLERGRFRWPPDDGTAPRQITRRELRWLLDGLSLEQQQAHPEVAARTII